MSFAGDEERNMMYVGKIKHYRYMKMKRGIDFILAAAGGIVLLPVLLVLAIAIKLESKGPVFFKQKRVGKNKKHFYIYKFRSMRIDTPKDMPTHLLENPEQYITRVGRFIRKTSLDELPQIFNILRGDMSIIGPRPALWNQDDLIKERDRYGANDVTPGLSGWAQVNGRDELEIPEKARLDGEYVEHMSLLFDVKCLFKTISTVIGKDGISEGKNQIPEIKNEITESRDEIHKEEGKIERRMVS